jgi:hypothetical protein
METTPPSDNACRHHWLLGQPENGWIAGVCRNCGSERRYPSFLEETERGHGEEQDSSGEELAVTAGGGARLSRQALLVDLES